MENLFAVVYTQTFVCSCGCDKDTNEIQEYFVDEGSAINRMKELAKLYFVHNVKVCKVNVENGRLVPGPVCRAMTAEGWL